MCTWARGASKMTGIRRSCWSARWAAVLLLLLVDLPSSYSQGRCWRVDVVDCVYIVGIYICIYIFFESSLPDLHLSLLCQFVWKMHGWLN